MKFFNLGMCLTVCLTLNMTFQTAAEASAEFDRHYEVGKDFLKREQYKLAVDELSQALKANQSVAALIDRGTAYSELKNYRSALDDLGRAIQLDPKNVLAFTVRGVVYFRSFKPELAIKDFDSALAIDGTDKYAIINRAGAFLMLEHPNQMADKTVSWLERSGWRSDFACHATVLTCLAYKLDHNPRAAESLTAQGLKKLDRLMWPYPLLKYWSGKADQEKVLSQAEDSTYDLAQGQAFLGLDAFSKGDSSTARNKLSFVSQHGVVNSVEYWLSKFYLKKLDAADHKAAPKSK